MNKKILILVTAILLVLPVKAEAFLDICFPISFVILLFILGWPNMIFYEFFGYQSAGNELINWEIILVGLAVNVLILFLLGIFLDLWIYRKNTSIKGYSIKIPLIFIVIMLLLFGISFIDRSCS